jgi:hypothetical protein
MTDENGDQIPKRINLDPDDPEPSKVFPDIIIHKHGKSDFNLLIMEIKMEWKNKDKERDFEKISCYIEELNYSFGLYLELGETGITDISWFQGSVKNVV